MKCYVYVLKSLNKVRYYIGSTDNINERLERHNSGAVRSTKGYRPWILVYQEEFNSRTEAYVRERQIKSYKGGNAFKKLLG